MKKPSFKEQLFRLAAISALAVFCTHSAAAQDGPPRYDAVAYCDKVAESVGGSSQINNACLGQEQSAYNDLKKSWATIPAKAAEYCDKVSSSVGGTYQILSSCIKQETKAAGSTPEFKY